MIMQMGGFYIKNVKSKQAQTFDHWTVRIHQR